MASVLGRALVVATLASALCAVLVARAEDCEDRDGGEPAHAAWIEGFVVSSDGRRIRVGDATLAVGAGASVGARRIASRLRPGDAVYAEGSLRPGGTVALTYVERDDGIAATSFPVSGVVRAVGADSLTVGPHVVKIRGAGDFTTRRDRWTDLSGVRVGDEMLLAARRESDGSLSASEGVFRMSGAKARLEGEISEEFDSEARIVVGGVPCRFLGNERIIGLSGGACSHVGADLRAGQSVRVRGYLRDGEVLADLVNVLPSGTRAAGVRVRASGYVGYVGPGGLIEVNGLELVTARRRGASDIARGERVAFTARKVRGGGLRAVAIARR